MVRWKRNAPDNANLNEAKSLTESSGKGASRRAINMFPSRSADNSAHALQSSGTRYHQLLITMEGNQKTGVLKVVNPQDRSRAGMLIFRGRVLGCVYGRKGLDGQLMDEEAHKQTQAELSRNGNLIDAYEISEEIVLAAASLFHGQILSIAEAGTAIARFESTAKELLASGKAGCVVINITEPDTRSVVYFAGGKVAGVFCARDGWQSADLESARRIIKKAKGEVEIMASTLLVDADAAAALGFSLSGLPDGSSRPLLRNLVQGDDFSYHPDFVTSERSSIAWRALTEQREHAVGPLVTSLDFDGERMPMEGDSVLGSDT